jgi:hypothetical protein
MASAWAPQESTAPLNHSCHQPVPFHDCPPCTTLGVYNPFRESSSPHCTFSYHHSSFYIERRPQPKRYYRYSPQTPLDGHFPPQSAAGKLPNASAPSPCALAAKNHDGAGSTERIEELRLELHCGCMVKDHALVHAIMNQAKKTNTRQSITFCKKILVFGMNQVIYFLWNTP